MHQRRGKGSFTIGAAGLALAASIAVWPADARAKQRVFGLTRRGWR